MTFKEHFNTSAEITYLNTPGNGLIPKNTLLWRENWDKQFYAVHSDSRDQQKQFLTGVRETVAKFFDADQASTFLTPNFSFAYSTLVDLLPKHYSYLVIDEEYPSLEYPIISRRLKKFSIRANENLEEQITETVDEYNPDVLVLSIVHYITGLKIDLEFIKKLKKSNPGLLIIADGTQFLGTEVFSFRNSGFDAIASSGYKWLLSGFGNGFLLINEHFQKRLENLIYELPTPTAPMWEGKSKLSTFFEPGHQDNLSHGTLQQSLLFLEKLGLQNIQNHTQQVCDQAYEIFEKAGLLLPVINGRKTRSSLINLQIDPAFYPLLLENGVKCFPRGTGIRIGIHLYNDFQDIQSLFNIIDKVK